MSLFVIEGIDGSGKSTQCRKVSEYLESRGIYHRKIVFPRYSEPSAALINMYLGGKFGADPMAVGPYAASTFFSVDRFASFKTDWGEDHKAGIPIICDRYTTSNAIHQASKLDEGKLFDFCDWLFDFEYGKMELPEPEKVIYLDMPTEVAMSLITVRNEKKDIHEADEKYLAHCRDTALKVAEKYGWIVINCAENGRPLPIDVITGKILEVIMPHIGIRPDEAKAHIRKKVRALRKLEENRAGKSTDMCKNIISFEGYEKAKTVFLFVPSLTEPDVLPVIEDALHREKRVAVPRCREDGAMDIVPISGLSELSKGAYGILEPSGKAPAISESEVDFALIPCLGVSEKGVRLGQGGGYYDRFLKKYHGSQLCAAFENCVFGMLPEEALDVRVKGIVTEERIVTCDGEK